MNTIHPNCCALDNRPYVSVEEFLYRTNCFIIDYGESLNTESLRIIINQEIDDKELVCIEEEVKYLMLCLLHFFTYAEIAYNTPILDLEDEQAIINYKSLTNDTIDRAILTTPFHIQLSTERFFDHYGVYTQYLSIYQYKEVKQSFIEGFGFLILEKYGLNEVRQEVSNEKLLDLAKCIYESFGESTQEAASNIHFHLGAWEDE